MMRHIPAFFAIVSIAAPGQAAEGMVTFESRSSFAQTIASVEAAIAKRKLTVFAKIDHAAGAKKIGAPLPPTIVFVFGDPRQGTPLMQARPSAAIDLPQKLLVAANASGVVTISYNDPAWLAKRHGIIDQATGISTTAAALAALVAEAVR